MTTLDAALAALMGAHDSGKNRGSATTIGRWMTESGLTASMYSQPLQRGTPPELLRQLHSGSLQNNNIKESQADLAGFYEIVAKDLERLKQAAGGSKLDRDFTRAMEEVATKMTHSLVTGAAKKGPDFAKRYREQVTQLTQSHELDLTRPDLSERERRQKQQAYQSSMQMLGAEMQSEQGLNVRGKHQVVDRTHARSLYQNNLAGAEAMRGEARSIRANMDRENALGFRQNKFNPFMQAEARRNMKEAERMEAPYKSSLQARRKELQKSLKADSKRKDRPEDYETRQAELAQVNTELRAMGNASKDIARQFGVLGSVVEGVKGVFSGFTHFAKGMVNHATDRTLGASMSPLAPLFKSAGSTVMKTFGLMFDGVKALVAPVASIAGAGIMAAGNAVGSTVATVGGLIGAGMGLKGLRGLIKPKVGPAPTPPAPPAPGPVPPGPTPGPGPVPKAGWWGKVGEGAGKFGRGVGKVARFAGRAGKFLGPAAGLLSMGSDLMDLNEANNANDAHNAHNAKVRMAVGATAGVIAGIVGTPLAGVAAYGLASGITGAGQWISDKVTGYKPAVAASTAGGASAGMVKPNPANTAGQTDTSLWGQIKAGVAGIFGGGTAAAAGSNDASKTPGIFEQGGTFGFVGEFGAAIKKLTSGIGDAVKGIEDIVSGRGSDPMSQAMNSVYGAFQGKEPKHFAAQLTSAGIKAYDALPEVAKFPVKAAMVAGATDLYFGAMEKGGSAYQQLYNDQRGMSIASRKQFGENSVQRGVNMRAASGLDRLGVSNTEIAQAYSQAQTLDFGMNRGRMSNVVNFAGRNALALGVDQSTIQNMVGQFTGSGMTAEQGIGMYAKALATGRSRSGEVNQTSLNIAQQTASFASQRGAAPAVNNAVVALGGFRTMLMQAGGALGDFAEKSIQPAMDAFNAIQGLTSGAMQDPQKFGLARRAGVSIKELTTGQLTNESQASIAQQLITESGLGDIRADRKGRFSERDESRIYGSLSAYGMSGDAARGMGGLIEAMLKGGDVTKAMAAANSAAASPPNANGAADPKYQQVVSELEKQGLLLAGAWGSNIKAVLDLNKAMSEAAAKAIHMGNKYYLGELAAGGMIAALKLASHALESAIPTDEKKKAATPPVTTGAQGSGGQGSGAQGTGVKVADTFGGLVAQDTAASRFALTAAASTKGTSAAQAGPFGRTPANRLAPAEKNAQFTLGPLTPPALVTGKGLVGPDNLPTEATTLTTPPSTTPVPPTEATTLTTPPSTRRVPPTEAPGRNAAPPAPVVAPQGRAPVTTPAATSTTSDANSQDWTRNFPLPPSVPALPGQLMLVSVVDGHFVVPTRYAAEGSK